MFHSEQVLISKENELIAVITAVTTGIQVNLRDDIRASSKQLIIT